MVKLNMIDLCCNTNSKSSIKNNVEKCFNYSMQTTHDTLLLAVNLKIHQNWLTNSSGTGL